MDDLELVRMRLSRMPVEALGGVAEASGVPYGTLWNIWKRSTKNPRYPTVKKLADHFKKSEPAEKECRFINICPASPKRRSRK